MTDALALRRDPAQAQIAGVCAALARHWGWSPGSVRIGFVILSLLTAGYAVGIYLCAWALIPRVGESIEPIRSVLPFTRSWSRAALVAVLITATGLILAFSASGPGALVVMGIVWWVMRRSHRQTSAVRTPPPPPPPTTAFERASHTWQQRLANVDAGLPPDWEPDPDPSPAAFLPAAPDSAKMLNRRRGRRTWLWIMIGLGLAYSAVIATGWQGGGPVIWFGVTLAVLGAALVLVARPSRAIFGRPRGLMAATVATAVVALGLIAAPDAPPAFSDPPVRRALSGSTPLDDSDLGMGDVTLDLAAVTITKDWSVEYTLEAGTLTIVVPGTGNVRVVATTDLGKVTTPGEDIGGVNVRTEWERVDDEAGDSPTLLINAQVDVGKVVVVSS
ncbi:MAG: PspC domain-containing protein [Propioniciclava sp.]